MQIGQTIWAIDPCEIPSGKKYLTVGKAYEIKEVTLTDVCVFVDTNEDLFFFKDKFDTFFSLTPPKEVKEGGKAEEIYQRFVQYEWNKVSEGMKKSILNAINEALKINSQS